MGGTVEAADARNALIVAAAGQVAARVFEFMLPTLAVVIASQTVAPIEQAIGWTAFAYLLYGIGALPAGMLASRVPARLAIIVGVFGCGVAALAAGEAANGRVLSWCLGVMGLCAGGCRPASVALLHRSTHDWRQALRGAVWAGRMAMVLTPALIATIGARFGWHPTLRGIGYLLCALAVAASFVPLREFAARAGADRSQRAAVHRSGVATLPAMIAGALAAMVGLGVALIEPWYFAARVTVMGYGAATSLVLAVGLVGSTALGRRGDAAAARRAYRLWHLIAVGALGLMAMCAGTTLLMAAAVLSACSLAARAIDERTLARMFAHRAPSIAAGISAAWTGSAAALAVPLVAAGLGGGGRTALLGLVAVELLVVALAARLASAHCAEPADRPVSGEPTARQYALLRTGSGTEPPSSC